MKNASGAVRSPRARTQTSLLWACLVCLIIDYHVCVCVLCVSQGGTDVTNGTYRFAAHGSVDTLYCTVLLDTLAKNTSGYPGSADCCSSVGMLSLSLLSCKTSLSRTRKKKTPPTHPTTKTKTHKDNKDTYEDFFVGRTALPLMPPPPPPA